MLLGFISKWMRRQDVAAAQAHNVVVIAEITLDPILHGFPTGDAPNLGVRWPGGRIGNLIAGEGADMEIFVLQAGVVEQGLEQARITDTEHHRHATQGAYLAYR